MIIKANWLTKFPTNFLFLVLGGLIFSAPPSGAVLAATENITQVNFVTEPQTILPNTVSGVLTIQTQNSSGEGEPLGETADVFLESTSGTGEFSSNATNWLPVTKLTMRTGSANRSFYYHDASEGSYTLTATVKMQSGDQSWTTTQTMIVSVSGGSGGDGSGDSGGDDDGSGGDSATSGQSDLSDVPEATKLAVGAGRPRLTTIGSPVIFKAITSGGDDRGIIFTWSFGDGGSVNGEQAEHTYQFPGTYVVVVNAYQGEEQAVARTTVRVIDPQIAITAIEPTYRSYIELSNPSADEVNLMSWRLYAGPQYFVFPTDTILPPNSKVKYPLSTMYLPLEQTSALTLQYPNGWEVDTRPLIPAAPFSGSGSGQGLEPQSAQLVEVAKKLALIKDLAIQLKNVSLTAPATVVAATDPIIIEATPGPLATTTGSTTVIELAKPPNLWRRIYELF